MYGRAVPDPQSSWSNASRTRSESRGSRVVGTNGSAPNASKPDVDCIFGMFLCLARACRTIPGIPQWAIEMDLPGSLRRALSCATPLRDVRRSTASHCAWNVVESSSPSPLFYAPSLWQASAGFSSHAWSYTASLWLAMLCSNSG